MDLFLQYLREKRYLFLIGAMICGIFLLCFAWYRFPWAAVLYPMGLSFLLVIVAIFFDFRKRKQKHERLRCIRSLMDIIVDEFPREDNMDDGDYQEIIRLLRDDYLAYQKSTTQHYEEIMDYYTVWVHQIKTPIASMRLHLQNEDSALSRKLMVDLSRVEQYVEMVLAYLRLDAESSDYVFKECELDGILRSSIRKFAGEFIGRKLRLEYEPIHDTVITDEKWLAFVVEQILSNALKYTVSGQISVFMAEKHILCVRDTGIGIAAEDLPRIFENGYTGYNGRMDKKASGIGLYLCKRICLNLGHRIWVESIVGNGTSVYIDLGHERSKFE